MTWRSPSIKWALIVLIPVLFIAWLPLSVAWRQFQVDRFYRSHAILGAMMAAHDPGVWNDPPLAEELIRRIPLGTMKTRALAPLKDEGLDCNERSLDHRPGLVTYSSQVPAVLGYTQWIIELQFDGSDGLSQIDVKKLNVFL